MCPGRTAVPPAEGGSGLNRRQQRGAEEAVTKPFRPYAWIIHLLNSQKATDALERCMNTGFWLNPEHLSRASANDRLFCTTTHLLLLPETHLRQLSWRRDEQR